MLNRAGKFKCRITSNAIKEEGENSLAVFICKYETIEEFLADGWTAVDPEEIVSWNYLECNNGSANEVTIDQLRSALGWDGSDISWLNEADMSCIVVQIGTDFETYKSKKTGLDVTSLKVKWVDNKDSTGRGTIQKADSFVVQKISDRIGAKLRAISGAPAAAPKPTAKISAPPRKAPAPAPRRPAPPAAPPMPFTTAWETWVAGVPDGWTDVQCEGCWKGLVEKFALTTDFGRMTTDGVTELQKIVAAEEAKATG